MLLSGGCMGSIFRVWTLTDFCGNSVSSEQVIHITDDAPPVFEGLPENQLLDCSEEPTFSEGQVFDNCSVAIVDFEENFVQGDCADRMDIEWVWSAIDECGNLTIETRTVTFVGQDPPVQGPNSCQEDFNADGQVNSSDLLLLLADFGCSSDNCDGDLNGDGDTNASDLLSFFGAFGGVCE
ncbi:MAG: dockerin type I domain-containing protein, partial [Flavobacteriales bacterium]